MKEIGTELLFGGFSSKAKQNRTKAWTRKDLFVEKTPGHEPFQKVYGKTQQYEF